MRKFFTLFLLLPSFTLAIHITEIQEVRLSKSELAYAKGHTSEALKILSSNIISSHLHLESYYFLANIYFELGEQVKAIRVYYSLVKRLHTDKLLQYSIKTLKEKESLKGINPPRSKALEQYFKIGKIYFGLADQKKTKNRKRFYDLAYKYFTICDLYHHRQIETDYHLGIVQSKREKYKKSLKRFFKVENEYQKAQVDQDSKESLKLQIADSLIRSGQRDAGSLYLQSVFVNPLTNQSIQNYAQTYLKALNRNYLFLKFSLGLDYNSNVHGLNDQQRESFDSSSSLLGKKSANGFKKGVHFFTNLSHHERLSFLFGASYFDNLKTNEKVSFKDESYWYGFVEMNYNNYLKSILKLNYSYLKASSRPSNDDSLQSYLNQHIITASLSQEFKKGTFLISAPIEINQYKNLEEKTKNLNLNLNYTPIWVDEYYSPSYAVGYTNYEELFENSPSNQFKVSWTNFIPFNKQLSNLISLNYLYHRNDDPLISYKQLSFLSNVSFNLKKYNKINFKLNNDYYIKSFEGSSKIKTFIISSEISYIF